MFPFQSRFRRWQFIWLIFKVFFVRLSANTRTGKGLTDQTRRSVTVLELPGISPENRVGTLPGLHFVDDAEEQLDHFSVIIVVRPCIGSQVVLESGNDTPLLRDMVYDVLPAPE